MSGHGPVCACGCQQLIPTVNGAKRRPSNPLRRDPSRMGPVILRFLAEVNRRFKELQADVRELLIEEDALGLIDTPRPPGLPVGARPLATNARRRWQFLTSDQKVVEFRKWLNERLDARVLSLLPGDTPWSAKYIQSAYKQALERAFLDTHRKDFSKPAGFVEATKEEFMRSSFFSPEAVSKLRLLSTRTFETLRGVTSNMSAQMARTMADGLANGKGVLAIARDLADQVTGIPLQRARTIARTETMHAHAEGQLDGFEDLGVEELNVLAEWSTAGDDRVCPVCAPLEGTIMTIKEARGLIPRHPNCRCTWIPANVGEKTNAQKRTRSRISAAVTRSLKEETGKTTEAKARAASRWIGADRSFKTKPPQD